MDMTVLDLSITKDIIPARVSLCMVSDPIRPIHIRMFLGLGDVLALTSVVRAVKRQYEVAISCDCLGQELLNNNPDFGPRQSGAVVVEFPRQLWMRKDCHIAQVFMDHLNSLTGLSAELADTRPVIVLSEEEQRHRTPWRKYAVLNAGYQPNYSTKWAGRDVWQQVATHLRKQHRLVVVQVGQPDRYHHPPLDMVKDYRGRTPQIRELLTTIKGATIALGPDSFTLHASAALGVPYVCAGGGRTPDAHVAYSGVTYLSSIGQLECCATGPCWRSHVRQPYTDLSGTVIHSIPDDDVCLLPVVRGEDHVPACLADMAPRIIEAVDRIMDGTAT